LLRHVQRNPDRYANDCCTQYGYAAYVVEISEHFAGYFDELGITITVRPDAKDGDIEALTEQVSDELRKYRVQFGWIVMIERAGKQVMVAVSGDR
jgi:hypothetical protein